MAEAQATDQELALQIAALERAIKVLKGRMGNKTARPEPGAYTAAFSFAVTGDIVVGVSVRSETQDYTDGALLAALCHGLADHEEWIRAALGRLHDARRSKSLKGEIDELRRSIAKLADAHCEEIGLTTAMTRAGAVTGEPLVVVSGSADIKRDLAA